MRRVVVTGMGVLSAIGEGVDAFKGSLADARGGIGPITTIGTEGLQTQAAAEIKDFDPKSYFFAPQIPALDRFSQYALVSARQAMDQSGLDVSPDLAPRVACIVGTGAAGLGTLEEGYRQLYEEGKRRISPFTIPRYMGSAAASQVSMALGLKGPAFATTSACSSATHAIGTGFHMVRNGLADAALVAGTEAPLTFGCVRAWEMLRVMAKDTCRPFSADRSGLVLGEGSGALILETLDGAKARGATILAEVSGFGMSADAGDLLSPSAEGAGRAMQAALDDAGLNHDDVQYINAHGTGTTANDAIETRSIHDVFGDHARALMVSSTKSFHGHVLGGSGALEAVATIIALNDGLIPPTINHSTPDPDCDLDYVPNVPREARINAALSNSFAFGGLNAVLAFKRFAE